MLEDRDRGKNDGVREKDGGRCERDEGRKWVLVRGTDGWRYEARGKEGG